MTAGLRDRFGHSTATVSSSLPTASSSSKSRTGEAPTGPWPYLGPRDLDDAEFWTFVSVDGTNRKPTDGFVRVPQEKDLLTAVVEASPGTVIEVDQVSIRLDEYAPLMIPAGVTIRGDRRGTRLGPDLHQDGYPEAASLQINGNDVRITGLRLRGPSGSTDKNPYSNGIFVEDGKFLSTIIDHNDLSNWTEAAVHVNQWFEAVFDCLNRRPRPRTVRVVRNFMHHNVRGDLGYGVALHSDGFAMITGNTFLYNRHAIAADGAALTGYQAFYNLVLSAAPAYGYWETTEQDFDMHGSDDELGHHTGGIGGSDVEIARNTFLGTNRRNYDLRGQPCDRHRFHDNVSRQSAGDAIRWYQLIANPYMPYPPLIGAQLYPPTSPPVWLDISSNRFNSRDPTRRLGVGDFDGDGTQDLFLATGMAWYYAPAGRAAWRYLGGRTDEIDNLLFGDADGDGRTDVFIRRGRSWLVSWGGASKPESINESDGTMSDFIVGDFDGDRRADIFYANGQDWFVSYGGLGPFTPYAVSPYRVSDLRFGDFNGDGKTDIFNVLGGLWMVRYGGTPGWSTAAPGAVGFCGRPRGGGLRRQRSRRRGSFEFVDVEALRRRHWRLDDRAHWRRGLGPSARDRIFRRHAWGGCARLDHNSR